MSRRPRLSRSSRCSAFAAGAGPGESATGNAEFNRAFRLHTADPANLTQWFTPALIAAHVSGRIPVPWSVQGTQLLCHQPGRLNPDEIPRHAAAVLPLADLLDGHGVADHHHRF